MPVTSSPRRVLVVDDHPAIARSLGDLLCRVGYEASIAIGGREGLAAFRAAQAASTPFAAVVTDLSMPDVDGLMVAAAIKSASPLTEVVLLTAYSVDPEDELPPHVDAVLSKPPGEQALRSVMEFVIARGQSGAGTAAL
jgi:CheY-like chemotaxis protein